MIIISFAEDFVREGIALSDLLPIQVKTLCLGHNILKSSQSTQGLLSSLSHVHSPLSLDAVHKVISRVSQMGRLLELLLESI